MDKQKNQRGSIERLIAGFSSWELAELVSSFNARTDVRNVTRDRAQRNALQLCGRPCKPVWASVAVSRRGIKGFTSVLQRYPDVGLVIVVLSNLDEDSSSPATTRSCGLGDSMAQIWFHSGFT